MGKKCLVPFANKICQDRAAWGKDVGDHPPITPLKAAIRQDVGGGAAWKIYEFVVRNFLGSLHNELQFTRRVVTLEIDRGQIDASETAEAEFELQAKQQTLSLS
jgi:DNA topoisomerase IA